MAHHREIGRSVVLSNSALILAEGDVRLPMEVVFNAPLRPAGAEDARRIGGSEET